jgi:hypothetical protein
LRRPAVKCVIINGSAYLDAGPGPTNYLWSTGETTQRIAVKKPGTYMVFIPVGSGGYISSPSFKITDILKPCAVNPNKNTK